jgi:hypothetical protein
MAGKLIGGLDPRSGCGWRLLRPERGIRSETEGEHGDREATARETIERGSTPERHGLTIAKGRIAGETAPK